MPLTECKIACQPADLFTHPPTNEPRRWFVVQTLARQEKSLARDLAQQQTPFFLPLVRRTLTYKGRSATSHVPLYAGYLFLFASEEERQACLATSRVAQIFLATNGQRMAQELARVASAISVGSDVFPAISDLACWKDLQPEAEVEPPKPIKRKVVKDERAFASVSCQAIPVVHHSVAQVARPR